MPEQADVYAQALYAALRELDGLQLDMILIEQPPVTEAWRAINDRLGKATTAVNRCLRPINKTVGSQK